jgi:putative two-component system response regulator
MNGLNRKARILVADDDRRIRSALESILESEGYEVLQAGSGTETLEAIRKGSPDVILLDIRMPDLDGLEVTRRVKSDSSLRHIPIVIVTGVDETRARIEALKLGADDFLLKPPHVAELSVRVRSLVQVKAYHDHLMNYQRELEAKVAERTTQLKKTLDELKKSNNRLRESSLNTIYCLSRAAEYKDEETAAHIQRMGRYATAIGRKLGLNEQEVEMLQYATPMHDVGKIGIPDKILLKPGKLSRQEWKIMQQHTVFGAEILTVESNGFMKFAQSIALSHHERWDGGGYPEGLKGPQIPRAGRIAAVADVFDALSSKRPYKQAFSIENSLRIVAEGAGSQFDPRVVAAFLELKDDVLSIKKQLPDGGQSVMLQMAAKSR